MKIKNSISTSKVGKLAAAIILSLMVVGGAAAQFFETGGEGSNVVNGTTYPFSTSTAGTLADMSTGTTQLVAPGQDDANSAVTNIGFTFNFDGVAYTQFSASSNGIMALGATQIANSFDNADAASGFLSNLNYPKIAPYYDDLCTGTGSVRFKIIGSSPNRVLVVEWQNVNRYNGSCPGLALGTFQAQLSETSGRIAFVYGAVASTTAESYTVGITQTAGITAASGFASVTTATNTVSYTAANNVNSADIAAGRLYSFGVAPTATVVNVSGRVINAAGKGISRTQVTLTGSDGVAKQTTTNFFGVFEFADVAPGETYIIEVQHRRYVFAPQVINVTEELIGLSFVGTGIFGQL